MIHLRPLRRAAVSALAATLLVGFVPALIGTAQAAAITNVSPSAAPNTDVVTLSFHTTTSFTAALPPSSVQLQGPTATHAQTISGTNITYDPATQNGSAVFDLRLAGPSPNGAPSWDMTVTNGLQTDTCGPCFTILASAPVVTSFTPNPRGQNATGATPFTITGANFARGAGIEFNPAAGLTVNTWTVASATTITGTFTVTAAAPGAHDVGVRNTDLALGTCSGCLTINPAPVSTTMTPNNLGQGAAAVPVQILGSALQPGLVVRILNGATPDANITVSSVTVPDAGTANFTISVADMATQGARTLQLINPDGGSVSYPGGFTVNFKPTLTKVVVGSAASTVTTLGQGAANAQLFFSGSNFQSGPGTASASFTPGTGISQVPGPILYSGCAPVGPVTDCSGAQLGVDVAYNAPVGPQSVTWVNPDFGRGVCVANPCITIVAGPSISSISPPSRAKNTGPTNVTINGANFATSGGVTVQFVDPLINGGAETAATVVNANQIVVPVTVGNTTVGPKDVIVQNTANRGRFVCTGCFTVDSLQINSVAPVSALNDGPHSLTINGVGFTAGSMSATLVKTGQPDIAGVVSSSSATAVVATFNLANVGPGGWTVRLNDAFNGGVGMCACFTVVASNPVLASGAVTPNSTPAGKQNLVVTVTGSNIFPGATLSFNDANITIVPGTYTYNAPSSMTATINVSPSTSVGTKNVTLTNTDGKFANCPACFSVTGAPSVTGINPATRGAGAADIPGTVSGAGFAAGAVVTISGTGVTFTNTTVSATSITGTLHVDPTAAPGTRNITVTNPDTGAGLCVACLTINAAPTLNSQGGTPKGVDPTSGSRGQTVNVTITGGNFGPSATVVVSGPNVTVTNQNQVGNSQITAQFVIDASAPGGARDVSVINTDGGQVTCAGCFTVLVSPVVNSVSPSSRGQNTGTADITVNGNGFTAGLAVTFNPSTGITQTGPPHNITATSFQVPISVAGTAPIGARTIRVTNTDAGFGECGTCFTIVSARALVLRVLSGTTETTSPVSGTSYNVEVTAKTTSDPSSGTDTGYVGIPVLTAPTDSAFSPGTCSAAVAGQALCSNVNFGDLGPVTLNASGTGGDSDRTGSKDLNVVPIALNLTGPGSGAVSTTLNYTLTPTAKAGADISGYTAARTVHISPSGNVTPADGTLLTCPGGACNFTLNFATSGSRTINVTDTSNPVRTSNNVVTNVGGSPATGTRFTGVDPTRVLDTRDGTGFTGPLAGGSGNAKELTIAGVGSVPANATAVVLNVTVTQGTAASFLSVQPGQSTGVPSTSSLNFKAGQTIPNFVTTKIGPNSAVRFYNNAGSVHVIADVVGYYSPDTSASFFNSLNPARVLDTRDGTGGFGGPLGGGAGNAKELQVTGSGGVPVGATAVILNVTGTASSAATFVSVQPGGSTGVPTTSSLNVVPGQTVPNLVIVKLPASGKVRFYNNAGSLHVIADVMGYFQATSGAAFFAVDPTRVMDTRDFNGALSPGEEGTLDLSGAVPAGATTGAVFNVTVVNTTAASFLSVRPGDHAPGAPTTSNLNWVKNQVVPNGVTVRVPTTGTAANVITFYNSQGSTDVVADLVGYYA